jgi:hypothetical protein
LKNHRLLLVVASIISIATLFVLSGFGNVKINTDCPNVSGTWQRGSESMQLTITQDGCKISARFSSAAYEHTLTGTSDGGDFDYEVIRTNKSNGCTTHMFGKLSKINKRQIKTEVTSTDGKCDLPSDFHEPSIWTLQD